MKHSPRSLFNGAQFPKHLAAGLADLLPQLCSLKASKYSAAVADKGGLRMRHTPCGYTKYSFGFQAFICAKISRNPPMICFLNCA